jgi:uncharacterized protein (DUF488 family)
VSGAPVVWTIGHSTHPAERFAELLHGHGVALLADVRTAAGSRRNPQFGAAEMAAWLPAAGIAYRRIPALGGLRRTRADSPNTGWRNASFRGYADYALTEPFAVGLAELAALARERPTAMMCAEAPWWRCHRRIVADHLVTSGWEVRHIGSDGRWSVHELTAFAVVAPDGAVRYPAG